MNQKRSKPSGPQKNHASWRRHHDREAGPGHEWQKTENEGDRDGFERSGEDGWYDDGDERDNSGYDGDCQNGS